MQVLEKGCHVAILIIFVCGSHAQIWNCGAMRPNVLTQAEFVPNFESRADCESKFDSERQVTARMQLRPV